MIEAIVMGVSAGGLNALKTLLPQLPADFPVPIAIVQHRSPSSDTYLSELLNELSAITVKEAEDKETLHAGTVYLAPAGYHLLIEPDKSFSLSVDPRVNFSCPAVDILFESAADVFGKNLIGVVLTGANADGSHGLKSIKMRGGLAVVQNPETAEIAYMPQAAIESVPSVDYVVELENISPLLIRLCKPSRK